MGWNFSTLTCVDPTGAPTISGSTATISVAPGETVTCTYTNAKQAAITVIKNAIGGNDTFGFTPNGYRVRDAYESPRWPKARTPRPAWQLAHIPSMRQCASGLAYTRPEAVPIRAVERTTVGDRATSDRGLGPGETVTCTYTNTKWGPDHDGEDSVPDDAQDFRSPRAVCSAPGTFSYDDILRWHVLNTRDVTDLVNSLVCGDRGR